MRDWKPGTEFDGYELVRRLGKGGMGEVHLAHDLHLDRPVAIKFILAADIDDEVRRRFLVEARAIARLQHPNVVSVYRVGEIDGNPYLVSEFIRGTPLDELSTPIPFEQVRAIATGIAHGLAAAHRRGVVHRDIKPANAILSDDGEVKLLDFGIAKLLGDAASAVSPKVAPREPAPAPSLGETAVVVPTETAALSPVDIGEALGVAFAAGKDITDPNVILGTPHYLAPELWRGDAASFCSDIYSFGALIYFLCTGAPPHEADEVAALAAKVMTEDVRPLAEVAASVDPAFAAIIDRCLSRDPCARYGSGGELRAALARLTIADRAESVPEGNPYRGLSAFEAEHQNLFFGRDSEIRLIIEKLASDPFVLVVGDSGVGKSSLCRAGILPRVSSRLASKKRWRTAMLVPGRHPVAALAVALAPFLSTCAETLAVEIAEDAGGVARKLRAAGDGGEGLIVFIDQIEELVTIGDGEETARAAELLSWLAVPSSGLKLLATARGDFLSRLAVLPRLGDEVPRALFFLRPLSAERIREIITAPAQAKGVAFESSDLVDDVAETTAGAEGGLPLLEFALAEIWEARDTSRAIITREDVAHIGGVAGALSRHADQVLAGMPPEERDSARDLLLRLVSADGTRARQKGEELMADEPTRRRALDALVRGRLVVVREGVRGSSYEIAHEVLLKGWRTLAGWLSADEDAQRVRERLSAAVAEWERLGGSRDLLWGARQLAEVRVLEGRALTASESRFLAASLRVRLKRVALRALAVAVALVGIAAAYGGVKLRDRWALERKVAEAVSAAESTLRDTRSLVEKSEASRREAFAEFDARKPERGEEEWARYLGLARELRQKLGRAAQQFETASLIDREREDLRLKLAQVLYERVLLAERLFEKSEVDELMQRLALYDAGGALRARLESPSILTARVEPEDAAISLRRYVPGERGTLREEPVALGVAAISGLRLPKGSYLLLLEAEGRAPLRVPFVLGRGENRVLEVEMPAPGDVPEGFAYVPRGAFLFGSGAEDGQRRDFFHAAPIHEVATKSYVIAKNETTFAEWIAYLESMPKKERAAHLPSVGKGGFQGALAFEARKDGAYRLKIRPTTRLYTASSEEKVVYEGRDRRVAQDWLAMPVVGVAARDAEEYAAWLDRSGRVLGARLCSEIEWERGARGADGREYPHGGALEPDDANYDATYGKDPLTMGPDEVGAHPASRSPFGLDDMAGNVWEWTRSSLVDGEYAARGGSWYFGANSARATDREITEPSFRDTSVGFRICADR